MRSVRAVSHIHSDWSHDGKWPLGKLAGWFARSGVDVLLMSEHSQTFDDATWRRYRDACGAAGGDRIRLLPGLEYSDEQNLVHTMVWGDLPFLGQAQPVDRLLEEVGGGGGIAVLAHPSRRQAWRQFQRSWSEHVSGVEVWNRKSDGWCPSAEALAWAGSCDAPLMHFTGLDFHGLRQLYPLTVGIQIEGEVKEDSVLDAMRHGRCTARAWGLPISAFTSGVLAATACNAERLRRIVRQAKSGIQSVCGQEDGR